MGLVTNSEVEKLFQQLDDERKEALESLGKKYFLEYKDDPAAKYAEEIKTITGLDGKVKLLKQFKLKSDDKRMCENCEAIVPADSVFCNKCGKQLEPLDFSSITSLINPAAQDQPAPQTTTEKVCPSCGAKLDADAIFCDTCGTRVG